MNGGKDEIGLTPLMRAMLIPALLVPSGCMMFGGGKPASVSDRPPPSDWHRIATVGDRDRLARWRAAWMAGIDKATAAGRGPQIAAQGALLKPDVALADPEPPPGDYSCRVIKMGAQAKGMPDYVSYQPYSCRILQDGALIRFVKIDGSQRPVGTIYGDDGRRMIFLGSMMLGDETRPLAYGRDSERDMIGILERVAPARWRIAFPYPQWESMIDVLELTPKGK